MTIYKTRFSFIYKLDYPCTQTFWKSDRVSYYKLEFCRNVDEEGEFVSLRLWNGDTAYFCPKDDVDGIITRYGLVDALNDWFQND